MAVKLILNPRHRNADLPPLSNGTQANGDHSCPVQRCFEDFTSHQLDLRRPTVHANLALNSSERSERVTPGHLSSGAYYFESSKPTHLLYFQPLLFICCDPHRVAAHALNDALSVDSKQWCSSIMSGKSCGPSTAGGSGVTS